MDMLVSINCLAYNHEKYISDAIEGFLMQKTDFNFEILIGEDCSTDHTRQIVESYRKKYPNKIKMITSDKNVGWRKNDERLFENSRGKYIAVCEGDDFWTDPYKLQKQVEYMESNPECSMCFHAARIVGENGKKQIGDIRPYRKSGISSTEEIISGGGEFCPTPSLFYPKKISENPPDFIKNAHVGDYPNQMWRASKGYVYYMDEFMAAYRTGVKGSWTNQLNSGPNAKEKAIEVKRGDISLLDEFNTYTKYKFSNVIENTKLKKEFEILLLQDKINELKKDKYKLFYKNLSPVEKAKLYSRIYFPNLYSKILEIKRSLM